MSGAAFSTSYAQARCRFLDAARAVHAEVLSYPLAGASAAPLAIDVAILGAAAAPALVISSGIHGIEGFFGSAVQLALLQHLRHAAPQKPLRWVLIHAVNPYGFAQLRRVNEDNVDLNRNFVTTAGGYSGAPPGYARLDRLLNPQSPPSRLEPFRLKALWHIQRTGLQNLKAAIAGGQYEYPRGLFYGGKAPCAATRIVQQHCAEWLGDAPFVAHIDLHTGLGNFAAPTLLLDDTAPAQRLAWYANTFAGTPLEPLTRAAGTAYKVSGMWGTWLRRQFPTRDYRFVGAEFGTHSVLRVIAALRAENRAHFHCSPNDPAYVRAKAELAECFAPRSSAWRTAAVARALHLVEQATAALCATPPQRRD